MSNKYTLTDLESIKADIINVKYLLNTADNNMMTIHIQLVTAVNKLDHLINEEKYVKIDS